MTSPSRWLAIALIVILLQAVALIVSLFLSEQSSADLHDEVLQLRQENQSLRAELDTVAMQRNQLRGVLEIMVGGDPSDPSKNSEE